MTDVLLSVLGRVELQGGDVFDRHQIRPWPDTALDAIVEAGILRSIAPTEQLEYKGCDHNCLITRDFQPHPQDEGRCVCIHRCGLGCGLLVLDPPEFDRWQFSLVGLAGAVKQAAGAKGQVVEDVRDRLVSVGLIGDATRTVELFLALGLRWPDATSVLQTAKRLHASHNPLVLSLAVPAPPEVWPKMTPATAVLTEHLESTSAELLLHIDLSPLLSLDSIPHPDSNSPYWITNTAAARLLESSVSDTTLKKAQARVSIACSGQKFLTNRLKGTDLRIDLHSFNTWRWAEHERDMAEERDDVGNIVTRRPGKRPSVR